MRTGSSRSSTRSSGGTGLAVEHYSKALAAVPDDAQIMARMAAIRADSQDPSVRDPLRAKALAERAASLTGGRDPQILEILAVAQAASGYLQDAAGTARAAAGIARAIGNSAHGFVARISSRRLRAGRPAAVRKTVTVVR